VYNESFIEVEKMRT